MAKGRKRKTAPGDVATNRQASYRYNLLERFECGIVLSGTEVKSLREGHAQLKDSYAVVRDGEVWLIGLYIPPARTAGCARCAATARRRGWPQSRPSAGRRRRAAT